MIQKSLCFHKLACNVFSAYSIERQKPCGFFMPTAANKSNVPAKAGAIRVNITTTVNNSLIRHEKRNGRDVIVVPSATLPDNVVMNSIMYPANEIAKSFGTLERTFAPFGHPMIGNNFVPAADPESINSYHVGAHNENVRRENGRVFLDKVIDVNYAEGSPKGKALLDAINEGKPISTSTGVFLDITEVADNPDYKYIASNMYFDHDAILLNEAPAASTDQGVGMLVNSDGTEIHALRNGKELMVINSMLDCYDESIEWAAKNLFDAIQNKENAVKAKGFVQKIMSLLGYTDSNDTTQQSNSGLNTNGIEENSMSIKDEDFNALKEKVDTLAANAEKIAGEVTTAVNTAVAPLLAIVTNMQNAEIAKEAAESAELVTKVVANGLLDEPTAKTLSVNALRQLAQRVAPGAAAGILAGNFSTNGNNEDEFAGVDLVAQAKEMGAH